MGKLGGGGGVGGGRRTIGLNVIVCKFYPCVIGLKGFYSSFYRHALIQKLSGANITVRVYIYRDSEERFTCRPTCRYNSYSILVYG